MRESSPALLGFAAVALLGLTACTVAPPATPRAYGASPAPTGGSAPEAATASPTARPQAAPEVQPAVTAPAAAAPSPEPMPDVRRGATGASAGDAQGIVAVEEDRVIVGGGSPETCTSAAVAAAVRAGGDISFDCGTALHVIVLDTTLTVCNTVGCEEGGAPLERVRIDGGGTVALAGAHERPLLYANACEAGLGTLADDCTTRATPRIELVGLTLVDGNAEGGPRDLEGGLGLEDLGGGGAVAVRGGTLALERTFVTGHTCGSSADGHGGAVLAVGTAEPVAISGSTFTSNWCAHGGAIAVKEAAVDVSGSQVVDNTATAAGGGLHVSGGQHDVRISASALVGNVATSGAGAVIATSGEVELRRTRVDGDVVGADGTALSPDDAEAGGDSPDPSASEATVPPEPMPEEDPTTAPEAGPAPDPTPDAGAASPAN
ncbi:hypothetical protein [Demequina pelophila]|uniref:hypothetical protein n=1 Tax=Demequina pelophila TaxID=1638984 RepID=UPI0007854A08|nr:hypothetical protein [Demequina pelophila]